MNTCSFRTLGCKVNQYETQSIRESFVSAGYRELSFNERCDVYVINTCTVTAKTDKESRRLIREAARRNPLAKIVVTGCYTELNSGDISAMQGNHMVVRNSDKHRIPGIIDSAKNISQKSSKRKQYPSLSISDFKGRTKAFLKIQDGCDNSCSYCKVSLVRGPSQSRDMQSSLAEARRLIDKGFKELVLTGICLGAWGRDLSPEKHLSEFLERLIMMKGGFRIRLSSIEPKYVDARLISTMRFSHKTCKHIHIPFQSGDDKILSAMNRSHTVDEYTDIVDMARDLIPEISITTDIVVGFPGETEENFQNTCRFITKIKPVRTHIFSYSKREATAASNMQGEVPKCTVKRRMGEIRKLAAQTSYDYRKNFLQKKTDVLVESKRDEATALLTGYDDKYIKILLDGEDTYKARMVPVKIRRVALERTFGVISQK